MKTLIAILLFSTCAFAQSDRIQLTLDTSEADAVLAIADQTNAKHPVADADWQRLFSSEPYQRLKKREADLKRDFTDPQFRAFVLSQETLGRTTELRRTLDAWKKAA